MRNYCAEGRIGRLILFKECLRNGLIPLIIDEDLKLYYYRGLAAWKSDRTCLPETCRAARDNFKAWLDYFRVPYRD